MEINIKDVRIDTRSPTTANKGMWMKMTHLPTDISVTSDEVKEQLSQFRLRRELWDKLTAKLKRM